MNTDEGNGNGFFKSRWSVLWIGFAAVAGFFLLSEHTAHVFGALPYLLLLACPLMHVFGHRHGGGHGSKQRDGIFPRDLRNPRQHGFSRQSQFPTRHPLLPSLLLLPISVRAGRR